MKIIYFTSTGNSLWVARQFTDIPTSIIGLKRSGIYDITDEEAIGVIVPDHVSDLPSPVSEYLKKVSLNAPYKFAIVTCGGNIISTVSQLIRLQQFDYVDSMRMVSNHFTMVSEEVQIMTAPEKHIPEQLMRIVANVKDKVHSIEYPSFLSRIKGAAIRLFFPLLGQNYKRFYIDQTKCVKCGICSKVCPMDNIVYNPWPVIGKECIVCGACRQNCPKNAIRFKGEKDEVQFRNPNVTVRDIIIANDTPCHI